MNVKQEPLDLYEDDVKIEPDFVNVDEIKQEIMGYEVPKIEPCMNYLLPSDHDLVSIHENVQVCPTIIVKKELENINEVKATYISNIKPEIESELLTTHCDLPTLKNERTDFPDFLTKSCGSKQEERISNMFKNIQNVTAKTNRSYSCPVCQKCKCINKTQN